MVLLVVLWTVTELTIHYFTLFYNKVNLIGVQIINISSLFPKICYYVPYHAYANNITNNSDYLISSPDHRNIDAIKDQWS